MAETNKNHAPVAASLHLDDERAKPKLLPCPFCGGPVALEKAHQSRHEHFGMRQFWGVVCRNTTNLGGTCCMEQVPSASPEAAVERWNRRTPPAEVSADSLPSLPQSRNFVHGYGASDMQEYALSAIAPYAEQIKKLERELAERKPVSIDTLEFQALAGTWCGASQSCDQWTRTIGARQAWEDLIAYIDARPAGTAPAVLDDLTEAERAFVELVKANPGRKLGHREAFDSDDKPLWQKPEALGLIECLGSYKWCAAAPSLSTGTGESK